MANNNSSVTLEEVLERYSSLKSQYENISKLYDISQQEVHDMRRNHQCVVDLKEHLSSEIDVLQRNETKMKAEWAHKYKSLQDEADQFREDKWKEAENFTNTIDTLERQITQLKQHQVVDTVVKTVSQLDDTKLFEEIRAHEEEISSLKATNDELKKKLTETLNANECNRAELESLKEQVDCLKSNLSVKKEELSSATDMLHAAQDDFCTATMELQQLKSASTTFAAKGNSLFAEVDDKRQEMVKSMSYMKDKVYQLNRELISKQAEIDSLLCEKKTLWEEYAGQSNHHDAALNRGYERRITDLEKQNDHLNREIARWFTKNIDPNSSEAAQWLSGVMEHYRKENLRLTTDLSTASVNNLSAEQKLRELQRQIVTWRTKAMETRATASELETKLQLAERTLQNVTNINITQCEPDKAEKTIKTEVPTEMNQTKDEVNNTTLREGFREINVSTAKKLAQQSFTSSVKSRDIIKPGILTSTTAENKIIKKTTSFK